AALAEGAAPAQGAAVPYAVELGLTVLHTALYAALFLFAYLQLWLLLYYRERRLSYHTLCLFLCLLWAALRTTLFSFYLQNSLQALRLQQPFAHWLLYCLPGCLLFSSLCLLNLYFAEGTSVCQAILVGSVVALLYSSRACYNLVAVAISPDSVPGPFNYGWDNLSDKVRVEVSSEEYVVFGVVLFLWELVPTTFVVLFFRAQRLSQNLTPAGMVNSHSYSSRAYFFDNPRRYDSDDDLSRLGAREGSLATPQCSGCYGSLAGNDSYTVGPHLSGTTADSAPLLFAAGGSELNSHHSSCPAPQN
uniref:G protein-coupled receptor 137C n=1 Tax=Apteryx owenii TaxID=8824 RepID=A0A8B9PIC8_APTOW